MTKLNIVSLLLLFCILIETWSTAEEHEGSGMDHLRINPNDLVDFKKSMDQNDDLLRNPSMSIRNSKRHGLVNNTSTPVSLNVNDPNVMLSSEVELSTTKHGEKINVRGDNNNHLFENMNMADQREAQKIASSMGLSVRDGRYVSDHFNGHQLDHSQDLSHEPQVTETSSSETMQTSHLTSSHNDIIMQSPKTEVSAVPNVPQPERVITLPPLNEDDFKTLHKLQDQEIHEPENILGNIGHLRENLDRNITIQTYQPVRNENIVNIKTEDAPQIYGDHNCSDNEVYIIDGERTLLLTNKKLTADIEIIQDETLNLQTLIENQDTIIFQLKQRLANSEAQVDDSLGLLVKHEKSYQKLLRELNETKTSASEDRRRNEFLEDQLVKEKQDRTQYQELSSHFKKEMDAVNERLHVMMDESHEQCDKTITSLQSKYKLCKRKADEQGLNMEELYREQNLIKDNLDAFNRTRFRYNKPKCKMMQQQLVAQDNTLILLKDQIKSQAHTLESMNRLVSMKHESMENIHNAVT